MKHNEVVELVDAGLEAEWQTYVNSAPHALSPAPAGLLFVSAFDPIGDLMRSVPSRHHNNCPRCPVTGAEDIPGDEFYEILSLRFNIRIATPPHGQTCLAGAGSAYVHRLKPGDAIMLSATNGADPASVTAINVLAGVEPLLTAAPQGGQQIFGNWNFDIGLPQ